MTFLGWLRTLTAPEAAGIRALLAAASAADGVGPVSDDVALTIRPAATAGQDPDDGRRHLVAADSAADAAVGGITGYAHLAPSGTGGWEAELVVHPERRRQGVGTALLDELIKAVAGGGPADVGEREPTLDIWAHGDSAAAAGLAARAGLRRGRVLLQMRRRLGAGGSWVDDDLPPTSWPPGVTVRRFEPGRDEQAWLAVNARAFADHPEQGRWTEHDLLLREAEPWFDPAGFFLAERDGELLGFHWTKVHAEDPTPPPAPDGAGRRRVGPIGEVYVVGVDPAHAGAGLGRALTITGLRHLRDDRGLSVVALYTDEDNVAAVRMYERLGFTRYAVDVQYRWSSAN